MASVCGHCGHLTENHDWDGCTVVPDSDERCRCEYSAEELMEMTWMDTERMASQKAAEKKKRAAFNARKRMEYARKQPR